MVIRVAGEGQWTQSQYKCFSEIKRGLYLGKEVERAIPPASMLTAKPKEKTPSYSLPHDCSGRAAPPIVTPAFAGVQGAVGMTPPLRPPHKGRFLM